jgi:hypothetical protein
VQQFLKKMLERRFNAVAVERCAKASGKLVWFTNANDKALSSYRIVRFSDLQRTLRYATEEKYFLVGEHTFMRKRGYPQGGHFSEPATMLDLGTDIEDYINSEIRRRRVGLQYENFTAAQQLAGVLHVDDCLLISKIWCSECILEGLRKLWPKDVGTTMEESGNEVRFLNALITTDGRSLLVRPLPINVPFIMCAADLPDISRFPPFLHAELHNTGHLRILLLPHIFSQNKLSMGDGSKCEDAFVAILCELFRLGWPARTIGAVCCSVARHHNSLFLAVVRKIGTLLKRSPREPPPPVTSHTACYFRGLYSKVLGDVERKFTFV